MLWFDADPREVMKALVNRREAEHWRARRHPLFGLLTTPIVTAARHTTPLSNETIVRLLLAAVSGLCAGTFFFLCLSTAGTTLGALVWTGVLLSSSSFMFWTGVPETYAFGSWSLLIPIAALALRHSLRLRLRTWTAVVVASLAVTVTNVMSGIAATCLALPFRGVLRVAQAASLIVIVALMVQSWLIPHSTDQGVFFLRPLGQGEAKWINAPPSGGVRTRLRNALIAGVVVPEVRMEDMPTSAGGGVALTVQTQPFSSVGRVGAGLWVGILIAGAWAGFAAKGH